MTRHDSASPRRHAFVAALATLALLAGVALEGLAAADRAAAGGRSADVAALTAEAEARPTAAAYAAVGCAEAARGRFDAAAAAAATAARLAPGDARRAAAAEAALDAALRARAATVVRPLALGGAFVLLGLALGRRRRRRHARRLQNAARASVGRLVLTVEGGDGPRVDRATLRPEASALILDAHVEGPFERLRPRWPLQVTLSHATRGCTVRLHPQRDWAAGAARWRVEGTSLGELLAREGTWRATLLVGEVALAHAAIEVAPSHRAAA